MKSLKSSRVLLLAGWLTAAATATTLLLPEPAHAADGDEKLAQTRLDQGKAAYKRKKYEAARRALADAHQLHPTDETTLYLGLASVKAKKPGEGAKYLKKYLAATQGTSSPEHDEAEAALAEASKKLGTIEIVAPRGTEITVDGDSETAGTTPMEPLLVDPGSHTIRGRTTDGASLAQELKVKAGEKVTAKLGDPNTGGDAKPEEKNESPFDDKPKDDKPKSSGPGLFSPPRSMVPVGIALGVAGLGGIGILVFGLSRNNAQNAANEVELQIRTHANDESNIRDAGGVCASQNPQLRSIYGQPCQQLQSNRDAVDRNALLTNISIGVAGVGAAAALGLYLFLPKAEHGPPPGPKGEARRKAPPFTIESIAPMRFGSQGQGIGVLGTF